jgi:predicted heme/steroid binding protein
MTTFTLEELKRFDGQEGRPAYIAFHGKVYDVTAGASWPEGSHYDEHFAGQDLTEALDYAPHGEEALARTPVVGELA